MRLRSYIRPVDGLVGPGLHGYPHRIVPHVATELFVRFINARLRVTGHLFQGRFGSVAIHFATWP